MAKRKRKPKWKLTLTPDGGMYGYKYWGDLKPFKPIWEDRVEHEPDHTFQATLIFLDFDWGERGAKRIWFVHENDYWFDYKTNSVRFESPARTYCMFASEFKRALTYCQVDGTRFTGRFGFRKQGQDFSIVVLDPYPCPYCNEVPVPEVDGSVYHTCVESSRDPNNLSAWTTVPAWEYSAKQTRRSLNHEVNEGL